jgi:hypothetical protein
MEEIEFLREEARRCRRLAAGSLGTPIATKLLDMAEQHERKADALSGEGDLRNGSAGSRASS